MGQGAGEVSVSACVRARCSVLGTPFLALSFGGGAVTEVLHALRCGLALSPVRHDLPYKKKKKRVKWRQNKANCATNALGCAPQSGLYQGWAEQTRSQVVNLVTRAR